MKLEGRRRRKRDPIPVLYISTEGTTEKKYFEMLKIRNAGFEIQVFESKSKNATGVVESCLHRMNQNRDAINIGIAVFDTDGNTEKDVASAKLLAEKNGIYPVMTNPCFELWLLMHFPGKFEWHGEDHMWAKLKENMPEYSKIGDHSETLLPLVETAIFNSEQIFGQCCVSEVFATCPSTNMHHAVRCIIERNLDI